jgi:hypothetical protein
MATISTIAPKAPLSNSSFGDDDDGESVIRVDSANGNNYGAKSETPPSECVIVCGLVCRLFDCRQTSLIVSTLHVGLPGTLAPIVNFNVFYCRYKVRLGYRSAE